MPDRQETQPTSNAADPATSGFDPATAPNPLLAEPELPTSADGPDASLGQPKGRRAAAAFIFFTVALDMLALGMIAPVLPRLIAGFLHGNTASAAQMLGLFGTVFAFMQFFFSPILGSLSDRFGRRPIVLLSNFGLGLDYLLMAWAPVLGWLFVGRVISGLTASSIPTAMAYMADVTPRERRAAAFGMLICRLRPRLRPRSRSRRSARQRQSAPAASGSPAASRSSTAYTASSSYPNRSPPSTAAPSPGVAPTPSARSPCSTAAPCSASPRCCCSATSRSSR